MNLYTPIIFGIEHEPSAKLEDAVRKILTIMNQDVYLIEKFGERHFYEVIVSGTTFFLSMFYLRDGIIELNEHISIKVKEHLQ